MDELRRPDLAFSQWETARRISQRVSAHSEVGEPPMIAGRYRLDKRIGSGSFGYVYQAHDTVLDRAVAIKTGAPRISAEARALAKLRHPNAVILYDHGIEDDCGYLVLELLSGQTLRQWRQSEPRDLAQIMRVHIEAGHGLAAAHEAGVVHRDFKPENVIVTQSGRVVVLDFGVATAPGVESEASAGTLRYMAPEQIIASGRVGPAADQFAFCVALWEAITGEPPFQGDDARGRLESILMGPCGTEPPSAIGHILRCGLAPSPASRWASMDTMIQALGRASRQSRRRPLFVAAAIVAAALGLGALPLGPTIGDGLAASTAEARPDIDDLVMDAAQRGQVDTVLSMLAHAEREALSRAELLRVAELADEAGLELYRRGEWLGSESAHIVAHLIYVGHGSDDLATRALTLAQVSRDARHRQ